MLDWLILPFKNVFTISSPGMPTSRPYPLTSVVDQVHRFQCRIGWASKDVFHPYIVPVTEASWLRLGSGPGHWAFYKGWSGGACWRRGW